MSEVRGPDAGAAPSNDGVSAGTLLRRAREAEGLHVAALAVALKVPVRKLEALEAGRYELLTDAVFVRALASSVCRTLKIDPQPVLDLLPQTARPRLAAASDGINAPFRAPNGGAPPGWVDLLTRPPLLAVYALLLGALVLILLPTTTGDKTADTAKTTTGSAPALVSTVVTVPAATEPQALPLPEIVPAAAAASAAAPVPAPVPAAADAASPAQPAPGSTVMFRAKGDTWVEVTDAKGAAPIRKILAAGETMSASGALPLQVTIGRVDATDVQVRGKPFDLRPVSKDNVARFEIK